MPLTAREFMKEIQGKKITSVEIVKGQLDAGVDQALFEITLEDGTSFVA